MRFLDWLLGREEPKSEPEKIPAPKGKIALLGRSNWLGAPFGLDLTGIPHTDEELDRATDLPGDFSRMHPDDQKAHLRSISAGPDKSVKIDVWQTTWKGKAYTFIVRDGVLDLGKWADEATSKRLHRRYRKEFKRD